MTTRTFPIRTWQASTRGRLALWVFLGILFSACLADAKPLVPKQRLQPDEKSPWTITARSLSFDEKESVFHAKGNVLITRGSQRLSAREAIYNRRTGIAQVFGDVRLVSGQDTLTGEKGTFDLKEQTGTIEKGRLFLKENHFYISGDTMEKVGENTYVVKACRLTTCDGDHPAWSITGSEVRVTLEGYGEIKHAAFWLRDWPVLYLPYMIFPAKTKRQTGLLPPRLGYSSRNGADVEIPFFWAISDQLDATFYGHYMSRRGYMQGLEFRYAAGEGSEGNLLVDVLRDRIGKKDLNDSNELEISPFKRDNQNRFWLRGRADQDLLPGLTARADLDLVSDQDYLREFETGLFGYEARPNLSEVSRRPVEDKYSPTRRSALRLAMDSENYSLQALSSYHQRPENPPNDRTPQPLAGLNFMSMPGQISHWPLFLSLDSDYGYVWREEGTRGNRMSLSPEMRFPWRMMGDALEMEPSLRYTLNSYWLENQAGGFNDNALKGAYDAGFKVSTSFERTYDVDWGSARRLKHRIWPSISYRYRVPHGDLDEKPWFEAFDQEGRVNQLVMSLENFLDARLEDGKGKVHYRQWATFSLSQAYDIDEARVEKPAGEKRKTLTPLAAALVITPFSNLDLRGNGQWDHYAHEITRGTLSLDLMVGRTGGRKDRYSLDYIYEKDITRALNFEWDLNLVYGFSTGVSFRRNMMVDQSILTRYWLGYQSQCWGAKLYLEKESQGTRIMLMFNLLGLGDLGTHAK
ncbi:MAG: LPS assembly protein LptD [Desulfatiglandaceae bacterium]